jgi:peroxidase
MVGRALQLEPAWPDKNVSYLVKTACTKNSDIVHSITTRYSVHYLYYRAKFTQEFAVGAFRVGHSQVSGEQAGITNDGTEIFAIPLEDHFANDAVADLPQIESLIRNLGAEVSQATDVFAVNALRNLLFAGLVGGGVDAVDLIAIDIQRQYDVGLGSLNQTRKAIGLKPYNSISDLVSDSKLRAELVNAYASIKNVDLFMGGLAEKHAKNALVGETFQAIIASQFRNLRTGVRFFWQNEGFSPEISYQDAAQRHHCPQYGYAKLAG